MMTADNLKIGSKGLITKINIDIERARRMREMGIIEGEEILFIMTAPLGDPLVISVMGYYLAIRKDDAKCIEVELCR